MKVYHVTFLALPQANLEGTLPSSLSNLTHLLELVLNNNKLSGSIPKTVLYLSRLVKLDLHSNVLSGSVPSDIASLVSIDYFDLSYNVLTGVIPELIGSLSALEVLSFSNNYLHGTLPPSIGNATQLQYLEFTSNALTGTLPASLGLLTRCVTLSLNVNQLHGPIPTTLTQVFSLQLLVLFANMLSGTIPESLTVLPRLEQLLLYDNLLSGDLPSGLVNMPLLTHLIVGGNLLNGTIPAFLADIPELSYLGLFQNRFTGTIPAELSEASRLIELNIANNQLNGTIPVGLSQLTRLRYLAIAYTKVFGTVPPELGNLQSLLSLDIGNNLLHGTLPEAWAGMTSLQEISTTFNAFTGTLPEFFGRLTRLEYIALTNNNFTGTIPASYSQLSQLISLSLHDNALTGSLDHVFNATVQTQLQEVQLTRNQLTGTLPAAVFEIPTLQSFTSVSNCFSGQLPSSVCQSQALVTLDLDALRTATQCRKRLLPGVAHTYIMDNAVRGTIPSCLFELPRLSTLHLSSNAFTGSLPANLNLSAALEDLSLSYNKLTGPIPRTIQNRAWSSLDLSYNRFSGTLSSHFADYSVDQSVYLQYNRLSGALPSALVKTLNVSVLQSNIFSCAIDRKDLPKHDSFRDLYLCGSVTTDSPYYAWLGCVIVLSVVLGLMLRYRETLDPRGFCANTLIKVEEWLHMANFTTSYDLKDQEVLNNFHLARVVKLFHALSKTGAICAVYAVLVLCPTYAVLSQYYRTHTYEYIWTVAAVLLSGPTALAVELVLLAAFVVVFVFVYRRFTSQFQPAASANRDSTFSTDTTQSVIASRTTYKVWRDAILFVIINLGVVGLVNVYYVFLKLNSTSAYQFMISAFKIVWSSLCAPYLSRRLLHPRTKFFLLEFIVSLCNTIVVPIIVVIFVSPDCFYNVFVPQADIYVRYETDQCLAQGVGGYCDVSDIESQILYFPPPYLYNFQCSYVFAEFYVPAFIFVCLIATFGVPLLECFVIFLHSRAVDGTAPFACIDRILPRVLKRLVGDAAPVAERDRLRPICDATQYIIAQLTYLCLLMTFGAVFPPLAVALAVTMLCTATFTRLKVGRLLINARNGNFVGYDAIVEAECAGIAPSHVLAQCMWAVVHLSAAFYALFLFDTLGDARGFGGAYWVLIVVPLLPSTVYCIYNVVFTLIPKRVEVSDDEAASFPQALMEMKMSDFGDICMTEVLPASKEDIHETVSAFHRLSNSV